jgi:prolipoprotein diacylglyceryltransferase
MAPLETVTAGWYNLFYTLAVAAAGWATYDAGRRRGWSSAQWTLAVGAWIAGGVIGAMLPHLIFGDAVAYRTSVGAAIVATLTLAVAGRLIGRGTGDVLDTTAVAIPLGAAVVRIGCFLAECCQGLATSLPVGIALHEGDAPRHPVQLYESFLEAVLAGVLARRADWVRPGRRFATSIAGMCTIRFATEFVRDNEKFSGLSLAQWVVLPIGALCVMRLLTHGPVQQPRRVLTPGARQTALVLLAALAAAAIAVGLPALEATVLMLGAAVLFAVTIRKLGRVAPTGLAVLALQMPAITADTTYPRRYMSIGGGANAGTWDAVHRYADCEGTVDEQWKRHHSAQGMMLEMGMREQQSSTRGVGLRARGYYGFDNAGAAVVERGTPASPGPYTQISSGIQVVGDADWKYFGMSLGVSTGRFYPMVEASYQPGEHVEPINAFAAFGLRVGPLHGPSIELRVADEAPMWVPAPIATFAFGLGDAKGNRIRVGVSEAGVLVSGKHLSTRGVEVVPTLLVGGVNGGGDGDANQVIYGGLMIRKWIRVGRPLQGEK